MNILISSVTMKEVVDAMVLFPPFLKDFAIMAVILSGIQVSPLKLNPWDWLKSFAELPARLKKLEKEFNDDRAFRWRQMIKTFTRQLERGEKFRESEWIELLDTVKRYENYCELYPDFKNGYIPDCIEFIRWKHKEVIKTGDYAPELKEVSS